MGSSLPAAFSYMILMPLPFITQRSPIFLVWIVFPRHSLLLHCIAIILCRVTLKLKCMLCSACHVNTEYFWNASVTSISINEFKIKNLFWDKVSLSRSHWVSPAGLKLWETSWFSTLHTSITGMNSYAVLGMKALLKSNWTEDLNWLSLTESMWLGSFQLEMNLEQCSFSKNSKTLPSVSSSSSSNHWWWLCSYSV